MPLKLYTDEFRRLQEYWYKILRDEGFHDIEELKGNDLVLKQSALQCYRNADQFTVTMKEEYFRCMSQIAHDPETVYRNNTDKYILVRHVEGAKIKTIKEELISIGTPKHRHSIRCIIRRYEMSWGIKHYEPEQLNVNVKAKA